MSFEHFESFKKVCRPKYIRSINHSRDETNKDFWTEFESMEAIAYGLDPKIEKLFVEGFTNQAVVKFRKQLRHQTKTFNKQCMIMESRSQVETYHRKEEELRRGAINDLVTTNGTMKECKTMKEAETRMFLEEALKGISDEEKHILKVKQVHTFEEIAKSLNMPVNTVKSIYRRALIQVKKNNGVETKKEKQIRFEKEKLEEAEKLNLQIINKKDCTKLIKRDTITYSNETATPNIVINSTGGNKMNKLTMDTKTTTFANMSWYEDNYQEVTTNTTEVVEIATVEDMDVTEHAEAMKVEDEKLTETFNKTQLQDIKFTTPIKKDFKNIELQIFSKEDEFKGMSDSAKKIIIESRERDTKKKTQDLADKQYSQNIVYNMPVSGLKTLTEQITELKEDIKNSYGDKEELADLKHDLAILEKEQKEKLKRKNDLLNKKVADEKLFNTNKKDDLYVMDADSDEYAEWESYMDSLETKEVK